MKRQGDSALLSLLSKQHKPGKLKRPREEQSRELPETERKFYEKRFDAAHRPSSAGVAAAAVLQSATGSAAKRSRADATSASSAAAGAPTSALTNLTMNGGYDDDIGAVVDVGEIISPSAAMPAVVHQDAVYGASTAGIADEDSGVIEESHSIRPASAPAGAASADVHELQGATQPIQRAEHMPLFGQMFAGSSAVAVSYTCAEHTRAAAASICFVAKQCQALADQY